MTRYFLVLKLLLNFFTTYFFLTSAGHLTETPVVQDATEELRYGKTTAGLATKTS